MKLQIIRSCAISKVHDKGLSEPTITLQRLLTFGRTLKAMLQQSKIMGNCSSSVPTPVHVLSKDGGGVMQLYMWRFRYIAQQIATHTDRNPPRKQFSPDSDATKIIVTVMCLIITRAEPVPVCICPLAKPVPVCIYRDPNTKGELSAKYQFCAIHIAVYIITDGKVRMVHPIFRLLSTVG